MIDDIRYLIVFAKIVETGSISKGAQALALSTATASQHLTRLEKNLGTALLYRTTRQLSLTSDGAHLLETAKAMLTLYEEGFIEFKQRAISTQNKLRLTLPALFIKSRFMQALADFIKAHPTVSLSLHFSDHRQDIIADNMDIAFRIGELPDSSLKARHLFRLPRQVVATPEYLSQHPTLTHPNELAQLNWIGLTMRPHQRQFHHDQNGSTWIEYQPRLQVDHVEASHALALQHLGLAAPPDFLIEADLNAGRLVRVLPEWHLTPLKVYAVWPPNVPASSMAYVLIKALYRAFNEATLEAQL